MTTMRLFLAGLLAAGLAACGGGTLQPEATTNRLVLDRLLALVGPGAAEVTDARDVLTAEMVARSSTPLILLTVLETDLGTTLVPLTANRGTEQWRDVTGGGLLRRDGILVGTRGFGVDLHTADVAPLAAALRRGGGENVQRVNRYIDAENRIVAVQYLCSVRPAGRERLVRYGTAVDTVVYDEACRGEGPAFTNRYWIDGGGTVRKSVELLAPGASTLQIDLLKG